MGNMKSQDGQKKPNAPSDLGPVSGLVKGEATE